MVPLQEFWGMDILSTILLITIQILRLSSMPRIMKEQTIIRLHTPHQPRHRPQHILLRRLALRVLLIIRQDHHILVPIPMVLHEVILHVVGVVDAASQLGGLPEVVYADEERFALSFAVGVLEVISLGCAMREGLLALRWWWGSAW